MSISPRQGRGRSVLVLAYWYPPENASGAARPSRFVRYLPQMGVTPRVLAAPLEKEPARQGIVRRTPDAAPPLSIQLQSRAASFVEQHLLPYNDRLPWLPHAVSAAVGWWHEEPFDAVFSTSPPLASQLAAMQIKQRLGVRWIADFRDPVSDNPFRTRRWPFPYDAMVERAILKNADAVTVNTSAVADIWRTRYPQWARKIHVIWNGYDPADDLTAATIEARPYRVISHIGTLYGGRHPAALLESLERLITAGRLAPDGIRVQLTGAIESGVIESHREAFDALRDRGILSCDGVVVSLAKAREIAVTSDYLLLLDLNDREAGFQVPAKLFEYIRIGRPILVFTSKASTVHFIMEKSGIPHRFIFGSMSGAEIDREVLSFLQLPTDASEPSEWFRSQFNCIPQTAELARLLTQ